VRYAATRTVYMAYRKSHVYHHARQTLSFQTSLFPSSLSVPMLTRSGYISCDTCCHAHDLHGIGAIYITTRAIYYSEYTPSQAPSSLTVVTIS
jgi:hypothetical protein